MLIETYATVAKEEADGIKLSVLSEKAAEELVKQGKGHTVIAKQTFHIPEVKSLEEFASLVTNQEVQLELLNRSIKQKAQIRIYNMMAKEDFQPIEGAYDATELVTSVAQRKVVSISAKLEKIFAKLSPGERELYLKMALASKEDEG